MVPIPAARIKLLVGQAAFLDELCDKLGIAPA